MTKSYDFETDFTFRNTHLHLWLTRQDALRLVQNIISSLSDENQNTILVTLTGKLNKTEVTEDDRP